MRDLPGISANAGENGPRPVRRPTNPGMLAPKNGRAKMSSTTTNSSAVPSPTLVATPGLVPSLEDLYQMTSEPDERVVIRSVDWAFYEQLVDSIPEGANIHVDYDGKDVEIMSPSPLHDGVKTLLGRFVELTAEELEVPCTGLGQTTWKRPELTRGLEADESYYFVAEKLATVAEAMTRRSGEVAEYPNPDLAIEVDLSPSRIDRTGIYAALRVAEVWRFDGEQIVIDRLQTEGFYQPVEASGFLPVNSQEIARWVLNEAFHDGSLWARRLRAWVRAELAPRIPR
jgi:Uma2 family endonuclease